MKNSKYQSLGTRLAVAAVWLVLCIFVLWKLPVWAAVILETVACFFMAKELAYNTGLVKNKIIFALSVAKAIVIPWTVYFQASTEMLVAELFLFVFAVFFTEIFSKKKCGLQGLLAAFFTAYVFPVFISLLAPIMRLRNGRKLVFAPFVAAWCSDAAAYFIGSKFGKHKLIPEISPKKSVEGALGGVAGGVAGMLVYGVCLKLTGSQTSWAMLIMIGALGSLLGSLGDLFLSYIKRECKIKDFGKFLPGHGGVLDRFDSALFVIPFCYYFFKVLS